MKMIASVLFLIFAVVTCNGEDSNVFLKQPVPVAAAPFGSQVELRCSVIEGYGIDWEVVLTSDPGIVLSTGLPREMELLRREGIEIVPSSSLTDFSLVINGTDGNNGAIITCVAFEEDIISEFRSRTSQVIFHGPPDIPFNLLVMENGLGSLNVSWSHTSIRGVAVEFTLTATNLNNSTLTATNLNNSNADPIVVTRIEDLHSTLTTQDNTSCDVYSFRVTARNDAGSSIPSDAVTNSFPALPDISAVEGSLEHSLRKTEDGITLTVTLTDVLCPEYPVHNYTLVVVDSEGNRTIQTSQATGDSVNIAISDLRENTRYSYHVIATNQFGDSNPSSPVGIATADIQGISICQVEGNTYSIRCSYLSGSDADGCGYILVSGMGGVDNITGRIEMAEEEEVLMDLEISSFSELLGFDLDSTGDFFVTSAVTNIAACNRSNPGEAGLSAGVIVGIVVLLVLMMVVVLIVLAVCLLRYRKGGCLAEKKLKISVLFSKRQNYAINDDLPNEMECPSDLKVESAQYDSIMIPPLAPVMYEAAGYASLDQDPSYDTVADKPKPGTHSPTEVHTKETTPTMTPSQCSSDARGPTTTTTAGTKKARGGNAAPKMASPDCANVNKQPPSNSSLNYAQVKKRTLPTMAAPPDYAQVHKPVPVAPPIPIYSPAVLDAKGTTSIDPTATPPDYAQVNKPRPEAPPIPVYSPVIVVAKGTTSMDTAGIPPDYAQVNKPRPKAPPIPVYSPVNGTTPIPSHRAHPTVDTRIIGDIPHSRDFGTPTSLDINKPN